MGAPDSRALTVILGPERPGEPSFVFPPLSRKIYIQHFEEKGRGHETKLPNPNLPKGWKPRRERLLPVTPTPALLPWAPGPATFVFC